MSLKRINESFKLMAESLIQEASLVNPDSLEAALMSEVDRLMSVGANLKEFEIAFQDVIEKFYPDKCWWEVCKLNIFWDLLGSESPEETVKNIVASIEEPAENLEESPEVRPCPVCGRNFAEAECEHTDNGVSCPRCGEHLVRVDSGEYVKEESLATTMKEEMDTFYGSLCTQMDADNEALYNAYTKENVSPADALISMGYQEADDHYLVKEVENDGVVYTQVFDFSEYDYGDSDSFEYYVLKDGKIPNGWTSTFTTIDEDVVARIEEHLSRLSEAEMSPEDREDSYRLRDILQKMQVRSNAALTPEEKAVLKKYNLHRNTYNRNIYPSDASGRPMWSRPLSHDVDRRNSSFRHGDDRRYVNNGDDTKINYADRARKAARRAELHTYGDGDPGIDAIDTSSFNAHSRWGSDSARTYTKLANDKRDWAAQQPHRDMENALWDRKYHGGKVAAADDVYDKAMSKAKSDYDAAVKRAEGDREYAMTQHVKSRDNAQAKIDKLLKKNEGATDNYAARKRAEHLKRIAGK